MICHCPKKAGQQSIAHWFYGSPSSIINLHSFEAFIDFGQKGLWTEPAVLVKFETFKACHCLDNYKGTCVGLEGGCQQ
eukprot:10879534-Ditylum_brightwellii.AAC.1